MVAAVVAAHRAVASRSFSGLALAVATALAVVSLHAHPAAAEKKNVLFFAVDDLRIQFGVDHVPGTGPKMYTPNIDRLIGEGLFLRKAQVQQAVCSPTRTSILTSRYPDTTRVWDLYSYFRDVGGNFTTIPEVFKLNGYRTIGMGKIFHPGHASGSGSPHCPTCTKGDDQIYSWTDAYFHPPNLDYWSYPVTRPGCDGCGNSWISVKPDAEAKMALPDTQTADNAVATLQSMSKAGVGRSSDAPFFLAVGFHKPHLPFVAPERFYELYNPADIKLPGDQEPPTGMPHAAWSTWGEMQKYHDIKKLCTSLNITGNPGEVLPADTVKELRRGYYASVSFTDSLIGRVVAELETLEYMNNTVISFFGDHGWQLGEHGEWCKHTNFDLATNAPMFFVVPGLTDRGIVSSTPTEYVDMMPTIVELATGIKIPPCPDGNTSDVKLCTHGVSLVPLITDNTTAVRQAAYSQYPRSYQEPNGGVSLAAELEAGLKNSGPSACLTGKCTMGYSMLTYVEGVEYRYTEWVDFNTKTFGKPDWQRVVGRELYNHNADPLENANVVEANPTLATSLSTLLKQHPTA